MRKGRVFRNTSRHAHTPCPSPARGRGEPVIAFSHTPQARLRGRNQRGRAEGGRGSSNITVLWYFRLPPSPFRLLDCQTCAHGVQKLQQKTLIAGPVAMFNAVRLYGFRSLETKEAKHEIRPIRGVRFGPNGALCKKHGCRRKSFINLPGRGGRSAGRC